MPKFLINYIYNQYYLILASQWKNKYCFQNKNNKLNSNIENSSLLKY